MITINDDHYNHMSRVNSKKFLGISQKSIFWPRQKLYLLMNCFNSIYFQQKLFSSMIDERRNSAMHFCICFY